MPKPSPFEAAREAMGLSVRRVAEILELDISGLSRIERGESLPKRDTAGELFAFYLEALPLGLIYDPRHPTYGEWLTAKKKRELRLVAAALVRKHPELAESDRRKA